MQTKEQKNFTPKQAIERAEKFYQRGNLSQAEAICQRIIRVQPGFHPAWFQMGLIAVRVGKLPQAVDFFAKAARLSPTVAVYHKALGETCRRVGRLPAAVAAGRRAAGLAPKDAEIRYNLGLALADAKKFQAAAEQYKQALEINPSYGLAANNLGTALERLGDEAGATKAYDLAVTLDPKHAEAQNNLGAIYSAQGLLDKAKYCFAAAIEANPAFVHPHYNLSTLKKYTKEDPHYAMLEEVAETAETLPAQARMRFYFAIGKAREDVGRYDKAFEAYEKGNKLKRESFKYDEKKLQRSTADIMTRFDAGFAKKDLKGGCPDPTPIFIVGMPRSGTTLIEQIVCSHSAVHGAGELKDFSDALHEIRGAAGAGETGYMDWLLKASGDDLKKLGELYIKKLRAYNPTALRITDKMPGNFFYTGLIRKALPNAKIINATRDPMDTCFSNYSRLFNETMPFAYDLAELGHYYRNYKGMMDHWKEVLPKGSVLDISYEEVVADQENQSKRLIEFCGLPWEEACLDFHKNDRHVKTASVAQVRKPIYNSSVARWEKFKAHLEPLKNAIEGKE